MKKITLSIACSIDGYVNDRSKGRLILSSDADLHDVQYERARHDAILVGAETVRIDNPSLLLRDAALSAERKAEGRQPHPTKVIVTRGGNLDPSWSFFQGDGVKKVVLCPPAIVESVEDRLHGLASVIALEGPFGASAILQALTSVGVQSVFIEGGTKVLSLFLHAGLFDDFRLAIAPFFVGDEEAPRLHVPYSARIDKNARLTVSGVRLLGDTTVVNYKPVARDSFGQTRRRGPNH